MKTKSDKKKLKELDSTYKDFKSLANSWPECREFLEEMASKVKTARDLVASKLGKK